MPATVMDELDEEYRQWLFFTEKLYPAFTEITTISDDKNRKECINILQHWLFEISRSKVLRCQTFPLLPKIKSIDSELAYKLINALKEKKLFWRTDKAEQFVASLFDYINEQDVFLFQQEILSEATVVDDKICVGKFTGTTFINQKHFIKTYEENKSKSYLRSVARMILRYECLGNGSYQWGDPTDFHKVLYKDFNVRYEGFASPINSRLLYLYNDIKFSLSSKKKRKAFKKRSEVHFCSLYPSHDSLFGSLGNFFDVDLVKHQGTWTINPPFVNTIMSEVSHKLISALDNQAQLTFFCTYPHWSDSEAWQLLENSKYCRASYHRDKCAIQSTTGQIFLPKLRLSLFCLSWRHFTIDELQRIRLLLNSPINECGQAYAIANERKTSDELRM